MGARKEGANEGTGIEDSRAWAMGALSVGVGGQGRESDGQKGGTAITEQQQKNNCVS